ncbi:glucan biosynthesis glucosyltransferase H, partial [Pseudomonas sp. CCC3.2]|nr:glucan biosynthesis glucosyltransferase H [Pseudomonas sp. CCC3.2]
CWAVLVASLNPSFLWWLAPIVGSLMLSIPVSVISSRVTLGLKARDEKLFLIPEEYAPPQELIATDKYNHENRWHALKQGFIRAVVDPQQNALACALATSRHLQSEPVEWTRIERVRQAMKVGPDNLTNQERLMLLSDPVALARLHEQVWSEGHTEWLAAWRESIAADPHAPLLPLQPVAHSLEPLLVNA